MARASVTRWVVVHAGSRDHYQVAMALVEHNMLEVLVTDWYSAFDQRWFATLARLLPPRIRQLFARRYRPQLSSRLVRRVVFGPALLAMLRRPTATADRILGRVAGRLAKRRGAGLLAYSYYANTAFAVAGASIRRLIFQVHPHPDSLRTLFTEEMRLVPECGGSLRSEVEMVENPVLLEERRAESRLADGCLVASSYTRQTLIENGVDAARIRVVPYGVDTARFAYTPARPADSTFRVLFVGQMVQRKGLKYLLECWRELALPNAELVLAGRGRTDGALLDRYRGSYRIETGIDNHRLVTLFGSSDIFCMPSLVEGFGLVYLEAMACGTPVIGTRNTGAADIVTEGSDGFVLDIRDVDGLRARLAWCHANRDALAAMRPRARETAERHSWARFRAKLAEAVRELGATPSNRLT